MKRIILFAVVFIALTLCSLVVIRIADAMIPIAADIRPDGAVNNGRVEEVVANQQSVFEATSNVTTTQTTSSEAEVLMPEENNIAEEQEEALRAYSILKSGMATVREKIDAAFRLIELLNEGILDENDNFVSANGLDIIKTLAFYDPAKKGNVNFKEDEALIKENRQAIIEAKISAFERLVLDTENTLIAEAVQEALFYETLTDETKTNEERMDAAFGLILLLNKNNGTSIVCITEDVLENLYNFCLANRDNQRLIGITAACFERTCLTTGDSDIIYSAAKLLLDMEELGIELPPFFSYSPSEFELPHYTSYDEAILRSANEKISGDNLLAHIQNIQDIRLQDPEMTYFSVNSKVGDYIYNYLSDLGIETSVMNFYSGLLYEGQNIIATIPGIGHPEKKILFTAHYDAVTNTRGTNYRPGANDNASGVAVLLEIARILTEECIPLDYTVEIVFFDMEEGGSFGSEYYVERSIVNRYDIVGVVNLDMVGWSDNGALLVGPYDSPEAFPTAVKYIGTEYYPSLTIVGAGAWTGSDQDYFQVSPLSHLSSNQNQPYYSAIGVIGNGDYPYYHKSEDTVENIDLDFLGNVAKWAITEVYGLANPVELQ